MFKRGGKRAQAGDKARRSGHVSVIGADVVISGDIVTPDELRLDGRIEGNVRCETLCQGADGSILGNVVAATAQLAGQIEGNVTVGSLVLEASARVTGEVVYESLSIAGGARVEGRFAHKQAAAPADAEETGDKAVAELFPRAAE